MSLFLPLLYHTIFDFNYSSYLKACYINNIIDCLNIELKSSRSHMNIQPNNCIHAAKSTQTRQCDLVKKGRSQIRTRVKLFTFKQTSSLLREPGFASYWVLCWQLWKKHPESENNFNNALKYVLGFLLKYFLGILMLFFYFSPTTFFPLQIFSGVKYHG